jgi:hypothetical protein
MSASDRRLGKLRLLSVACVVIACTAIVLNWHSRDITIGYFLVPVLLLASAIELIRLELRDLRRKNSSEKKDD